MPYYIRVLSTATGCIPLETLQSRLKESKLEAVLSADQGTEDSWEQLILQHSYGPEIASIERNPVGTGSLGAEELAEFADEIADARPEQAVSWLREYFRRVKCIYAFQLLSGTDYKNGWDILYAVRNPIASHAPSISQADGEGFSNEQGFHILWQFSDSAHGQWNMGVLRDGQWVHFEMDLGNRDHREAFFKGEVPRGCEAQRQE
jgi:hypothetical protein